MSENMPSVEPKETMEQFMKRAEEATGLSWDQIPDGVAEDQLGNQILIAFDKWVVVTHGYPDKQADGTETWDPKPKNFRKIDTTK